MPQIQIQQTFGRIDIRTTPRQIELKSTQADLEIHQEPIQLNIRYEKEQLNIDQSEAFADADDKTMLRLTQDEAARAVQEGMQGIEDSVAFGDQSAHIERKQNVIAEHAFRNVGKVLESNIGVVPQPFHVHITYSPGSVHITPNGGALSVHATIHKPELDVKFSKVNVSLEQKPGITITAPPIIDFKV